MIDWDSLVLSPLQSVFSDPIAYAPTVSQPGAAPFLARGIFAQRPTRWETAEGGLLTTLETTLGIMLADYPVPPRQGDSLVRSGVTWFVWDVNADGQGGASLSIKMQRKPAE